MTDRERLVELLRKDNCCIDYDCNKCLSNTHCYPKTVADLILADGWIRPPFATREEAEKALRGGEYDA